jgi:hypothetical protein
MKQSSKHNNTITMKLTTIITAGILLGGSLQSCKEKKNAEAIADEPIEALIISKVEPDEYFSKALEDFMNKRYDSSAKNIERAALVLSQIGNVEGGTQVGRIHQVVLDLEELATDVSTDHVDGIEELNYYFNEAGRALAGYKMIITKDEFIKLAPKEQGTLLKAITEKMEESAKYSRRELNEAEKGLIADARAMSEKLAHNEKVSEMEVSEKFKQLKDQLAKWDKEFKRPETSK